MTVVYLIPHSLRGSELDYGAVDAGVPAVILLDLLMPRMDGFGFIDPPWSPPVDTGTPADGFGFISTTP